MGKLLFFLIILILCLILPFFMGRWCSFNTELLVNHYLEKNIDLPNWPFVLGAYFSQLGLPYGIITEIWCKVIEVK